MRRYSANCIDSSAVEELPIINFDEITDDLVFCTSQNGVMSTDTNYGSRNFTFGELTTYLSSVLSVPADSYNIGQSSTKLTSIHIINGLYAGYNDI